MPSIVFRKANGEVQRVEAEQGRTVMEAAVRHNIAGIDAECGGVCACATCHVYVDPEWQPRLQAPDEDEAALLEFAIEPRDNSRLACQITVTAALDGIVLWLPEKP